MAGSLTLGLRGGRTVSLERPVIMAVLNVTPDSFFDGGSHNGDESVLAAAERAVSGGATIIDIGGESSRPGAEVVHEDVELERVLPAVKLVREKYPHILISIDTYKEGVARAAVAAGADIVNDISSGEGSDGRIFDICLEQQVPVILMHKQGDPANMQDDPQYGDVVKEVSDYLREKAEFLLNSGLSRDRIILDPGIGFGKKLEHNVCLIKKLSIIKKMGFPVLIGASMKRIVGDITGAAVAERLPGTLGVHLAAVENGADIIRVHDAGAMKQVLQTFYTAVNR